MEALSKIYSKKVVHVVQVVFIKKLPCRSADDEAGADDALLDVTGWQGALDKTDEDVGSLLAHTGAPLLDGGEHGVAGDGTLAVGEAADADVLRHSQAHSFHGVEDADGCVVVDGEERVRIVVAVEHIRCDELGILTVVTIACELLVEGQAMFQQGILIAVETVFRDFQVHLRAIVGNASAARLDEIADGVEGSHIVVDDDAAGIDACANAVVEHERHTSIDESLEVLVALCVLSLRNDDATHLVLVERLAEAHLTLILLAALCHHDTVAVLLGLFLDALQDGAEIVVHQLWYDDANDLHRLHP